MSDTRSKPTQHEIAGCAYCIWERKADRQGQALNHWLQAELQLVVATIWDEGATDPIFSTSTVKGVMDSHSFAPLAIGYSMIFGAIRIRWIPGRWTHPYPPAARKTWRARSVAANSPRRRLSLQYGPGLSINLTKIFAVAGAKMKTRFLKVNFEEWLFEVCRSFFAVLQALTLRVRSRLAVTAIGEPNPDGLVGSWLWIIN